MTPNFCQTCATGMTVSASGLCITITTNISNCQLYSGASTCAYCANGFQLSGNTCVTCQVEGCQTCSANNTCSSSGCLSGYTFVTGGTCALTECPPQCSSCTGNSGVCTGCIAQFNPTPAPNGTCLTCNVANCAVCNNQDTTTCVTCKIPYVLSNGICSFPCDTDLCSICNQDQQGTIPGTCAGCVQGYYLTASNSCAACNRAPVCLTCTATACTACVAGFFTSDGACVACTSGCAVCTGPDSNECTQFVSGTLFTFANGTIAEQPVLCDQGCASCSAAFPQACLQCRLGYFWRDWTCFPCSTSCASCVADAPGICLSCFSNGIYNATGQSCSYAAVALNCLTFSQSVVNVTTVQTCTSCPFGFVLSGNGTNINCTKRCPQNCLSCYYSNASSLTSVTGQNYLCSSCETGYSLTWYGVCLPCISNCRVCSGANQNICLQCGLGFYLNNYQCAPCPNGCQICNLMGCTQCADSFRLVSNLTTYTTSCEPVCVFPCLGCSSTNATACVTCFYGYILQKSGQQSQYSSCVQQNQTCSDSNGCYSCPLGQVISGGECVACGFSCARCMPDTLNNCTTCYSGMYLNTTFQCNSCPANCTTCTGVNNCLTCATGYVQFTQPVGTTRVYCTPCSTPCKTCTVNPDTCTSCITGFSFTGWSCVSDFYYIFSMTFGVNSTTFFDNYISFVNTTAAAMQTKNYKVLSVNYFGLSSGSTIVNTTLSTVLTSTNPYSNAEFANLEFALTGRGNFANMPVISTSLAASATLPYVNHAPSFFSALFIPLGFLLLAGVVYYICSRGDYEIPGSNYVPPSQSSRPGESMELREM